MAENTTNRVKALLIIAWALSGALVLALGIGGALSFIQNARAQDQAGVLERSLAEHENAKQVTHSANYELAISLDKVSETEQAFAADIEARQSRRLACLERPMVSFPHGLLMCDVHLARDDAFIALEQEQLAAETVRDNAQRDYSQALTAEGDAAAMVGVANTGAAEAASVASTTLWASAIAVGVLLLSATAFWVMFAVARRAPQAGTV